MDKLLEIQYRADTLVNSIIATDEAIAHWWDSPKLRRVYDLAQQARDTAVTDCVDISERCESVHRQFKADRSRTVSAALLEKVNKIERACSRVVRDCAKFHDYLSRLARDSKVGSAATRNGVQGDSKRDVVESSEEMLRVAREVAESACERVGVKGAKKRSMAKGKAEDGEDKEEGREHHKGQTDAEEPDEGPGSEGSEGSDIELPDAESLDAARGRGMELEMWQRDFDSRITEL